MIEVHLIPPGASSPTVVMVETVPHVGETVILEAEEFTVLKVLHTYTTGGRRGGIYPARVQVLLVSPETAHAQ